jgi:hypothetical protein
VQWSLLKVKQMHRHQLLKLYVLFFFALAVPFLLLAGSWPVIVVASVPVLSCGE